VELEESELLLESLSLLLLLDADNLDGPPAPPAPTTSTDLLLSSTTSIRKEILNFLAFLAALLIKGAT
jgi:hypothetical protein